MHQISLLLLVLLHLALVEFHRLKHKPEDYSQDWRGSIELLDLKTLAENVKLALSCTYIGYAIKNNV